MRTQMLQNTDWHQNYQDDEYLELSLKRLEGNAFPLVWCVQFADIIREYFPITDSQLSINDIGCNVGHFCRVILDNPVAYNGFDISETYLNIARRSHPQHKFTNIDIANEKPETNADISIMSATLEHITKWEEALKNVLYSTTKLVLLRTFFDNEPAIDMYKKSNAIHPYLIRKFTFEQVAKCAASIGFSTQFIRDRATDSIPQYLGCGITRTQYVAVLRREQNYNEK